MEKHPRTADLFRVARKRLQLLLVLFDAGNFVYRALPDVTPAGDDFQDTTRGLDYRPSDSRLAASHHPETRLNNPCTGKV